MPKETFDTLFEALQNSLKESGKVEKVSKHFRSKDNNMIAMIDAMWNLEEFHEKMSVKVHAPVKDTLRAEQAKSAGNNWYSQQKLLKALTGYNTSIRHVNPENDCLKTLAIAYGNRSCVLYELGLYDRCLEDIQRALDHNFPVSVRNKIYRRRVKCYLSTKQFKKAETAWKDYEDQKLNDNVKIESFKEFFDQFLKGPKGRPDSKFVNIINKQRDLTAPKPMHCHSNIPVMSDAISIQYTKEKGRHLIAERDIKPGEVLISEPAFATVLLRSQMSSHCTYCLKRTMNPIPCKTCTFSVFCNEQCRYEANRLFHSIECSIMQTLLSLEMGINATIALRIIVLLMLSPEYQLPQTIEKGFPGSDPKMAGFDTNGVYDSSSYRPIHYLVDNFEQRSVGDNFKRTAIALTLFKLLLTTSIGQTNEVLPDKKIPRNIVPAAELLLKLNMSMPCNAHTLTEFYEDRKDYSKSESDDIGAGAFAVLSLVNHSCNPNISRICYGNTVVARSISFIAKGVEVTDSYGVHYAMSPINLRKEVLSRQYYFSCTCYPCTMNWKLYMDMDSRVRARCPFCGIAIEDLDGSHCPQCSLLYGETTFSSHFPYPVNRRRINDELNDMVEQYQISFANVIKGNCNVVDVKIIEETVELLSKYSALPNKIYFEAQEALKYVQIGDGLRYVKFAEDN